MKMKRFRLTTTPLTPVPFPPRKRRERGDLLIVNANHVPEKTWVAFRLAISRFLCSSSPEQTQSMQDHISQATLFEVGQTPFPSACTAFFAGWGKTAGVRGAELAKNCWQVR